MRNRLRRGQFRTPTSPPEVAEKRCHGATPARGSHEESRRRQPSQTTRIGRNWTNGSGMKPIRPQDRTLQRPTTTKMMKTAVTTPRFTRRPTRTQVAVPQKTAPVAVGAAVAAVDAAGVAADRPRDPRDPTAAESLATGADLRRFATAAGMNGSNAFRQQTLLTKAPMRI